MQDSKKVSVLIVDDDVMLARMVSVLLSSEGFLTATAHNGIEALSLLEQLNADIILLDLQMPGMDGRTFYRQYRALGKAAPVIIFSAYNAAAARVELGADEFLNKPCEPFEIGACIMETLRKRASR